MCECHSVIPGWGVRQEGSWGSVVSVPAGPSGAKPWCGCALLPGVLRSRAAVHGVFLPCLLTTNRPISLGLVAADVCLQPGLGG